MRLRRQLRQLFRHRDQQRFLHSNQTASPQTKRQRRFQLSRQLQLLRAHRFIAKVPRTHRYRITMLGEQLMAQSLAFLHPAPDSGIINPLANTA